jgi:hypothetical protein
MAAGLKQAFQPSTDWDDDTPAAKAAPEVKP